MEITVAAYNVLRGGHSSYKDSHTIDPPRLSTIKEAFRTTNADVILVSDSLRWEKDNLNSTLGYPYAASCALQDERLQSIAHDNGVTILSRYFLEEVQTISLGSRNALSATVSLGEKRVTLVSAYLDDKSERTRRNQNKLLIKALEGKEHVIIGGDFNSQDKTNMNSVLTQLWKLIESVPLRIELLQTVQQVSSSTQIETLESFGYSIARSIKYDPSFPTTLHPVGKILGFPLLRLDHIATKGISILDSTVLKGQVFEEASDHYPVKATIYL